LSGRKAGSLGYSALNEVDVSGVQFDSCPVATEFLGGDEGGAGASVGVEDGVTRLAGDLNAAAGEGHGHDGRVVFDAAGAPFPGFGVDVPHGSQPATVGTRYGGGVVVVVLVLGQQEHRLMRFGGAVGDRLGMGVGLVPDDFGAQPPARILEGECQSPGNADQVFRLQAFGGGRPNRHGPSPVLAVWRPIPSIAGGVGVAYVQPRRAVIGQHPAHLVEGHDDALDVFPQSVVASDLPLGCIVPQRPIGR